MGWSIGYDPNWKRDIGYGVPAECDHPGCSNKINRGLPYVCGGEPYGGEEGCGLYFCDEHLQLAEDGTQLCERCHQDKPAFDPKPDLLEWRTWKRTHDSWAQWRKENPKQAAQL